MSETDPRSSRREIGQSVTVEIASLQTAHTDPPREGYRFAENPATRVEEQVQFSVRRRGDREVVVAVVVIIANFNVPQLLCPSRQVHGGLETSALCPTKNRHRSVEVGHR